MFCPACLAYRQQVEAVSQVDGTAYCAAHAVEALDLSRNPRRRGMPGGLQPLSPPVPPAEQPEAPAPS
jgi:hypothetical protein